MTRKARVQLSKKVIEGLTFERDGQWITDSEVPDLVLRLTPTGRKTFVARWNSRRTGKRSEKKIAAFGEISIAEARKRARDIVSKDQHTKATTLADMWKIWNDSYRSTASHQHASDVEYAWNKVLGPDLGHMKLAKITHGVLQEWYNKKRAEHYTLQNGKQSPTPYSAATVKRWMSYVSRLLTIARQRGDLIGNPAEGLVMADPHVRVDVFTKDDMKQLGDNLNTVEDDYPVAVQLIRFLCIFPCRGGEARGMEWGDVDLVQRTWTIPAHRYKTRETKVFALGPLQVKFLQDTPRWCERFVFPRPSTLGLGKSRMTNEGKVLPIDKGHQIRVWLKVRPKPLGAHVLRKTIATTMLHHHMPLEVVSKLLGHSTTLVTQQAYAHMEPALVSKHLERFNAILEEDQPKLPPDEDAVDLLCQVAQTAAERQREFDAKLERGDFSAIA